MTHEEFWERALLTAVGNCAVDNVSHAVQFADALTDEWLKRRIDPPYIAHDSETTQRCAVVDCGLRGMARFCGIWVCGRHSQEIEIIGKYPKP